MGFFVSQLQAQNANFVESGFGPDVAAQQRDDSERSGSSSTAGGSFSGWPVLAVPGVASIEDLNGAGVLFGAGVSEGYGRVDSTIPGELSGSISVVQPYLGFFQAGPRHKLLLEYSPTVDLYERGQFQGEVLERASIRTFTDLSRRLRWVLDAYGTSGSEYLRELSGLGMGEYPGWLTFTIPSEQVVLASATTGLHWRSNPLREFSLTFDDTYSSVRNGPQYDAGLARLQMTSYFARNSNWFAFGQVNRFSNQPGCTRIEPGVGFVYHFESSTTLALEGGPSVANGPCAVHLTSDFAAKLDQKITRKTTLYLSAGRDLVEPYLLQSRWTDIFSAKIGQKTSQSTSLSVGAAYARSSDLPDTQLSRYRGFQAFSEFNWHLSESVKFVASYRYFKRDFNLADNFLDPSIKDRNSWVFVSLVWHPASRSIRRAN
jgi:hypothetical protein